MIWTDYCPNALPIELIKLLEKIIIKHSPFRTCRTSSFWWLFGPRRARLDTSTSWWIKMQERLPKLLLITVFTRKHWKFTRNTINMDGSLSTLYPLIMVYANKEGQFISFQSLKQTLESLVRQFLNKESMVIDSISAQCQLLTPHFSDSVHFLQVAHSTLWKPEIGMKLTYAYTKTNHLHETSLAWWMLC